MITNNDLATTLSKIVSILSTKQIGFHLTGGLASSFYGEPRFTQDIDIVIQISVGPLLNELLTALSQGFFVDMQSAEDLVRRRSIFQALDEESMIKIDFHVGEAIPGELERSRIEEILPGITVPLVSKEDAILSKLLWIQKGSHKGRQDVKMMLQRPEAIDLEYLADRANALKVMSILEELRGELGAEQ